MTKYSVETKLKAIKLVKSGYSSRVVAAKMHIGSHKPIDNWLSQYQKYGKQALQIKLRHRYYSGEFKLKVLNWRKQHCESYLATAMHFGIPYDSTIANWQRKLNQGGIEALFTKRGRPAMVKKKKQKRQLDSDELSELKKLRLENRALHVENEYLKKLAALVQKRGHRPRKDGSSKS